MGASEVWRGWCGGSAGWALLRTLAWQVTGSERLLRLAGAPARHAAELVVDADGAVCCGLAGRSFAALALHRVTREEAWLRAARSLAAAATRAPCQLPQGLMGGDFGAALASLEADTPDRAAMPLFERLR